MTDYFLPNHVYFCAQGDAIVFLDLKNDQYSMLSGTKAHVFLSALSNTTTTGPAAKMTLNRPAPDSLHASPSAFSEILSSGLLTTDTREGKAVRSTQMPPATARLFDREFSDPIRIRIQHIWRFVVSCAVAWLRLHLQRLEKTVRSVERRKVRRSARHPLDWSKASYLVAVFSRLRPLFPANYFCLFDSLALVEFLARHNTFPTWVFAVRTDPWGAHCWVQEGDTLFNDGTDDVAEYLPIMTI